MLTRQQAIDAAWELFKTQNSASEVDRVEANAIDDSWAVVFHKRANPHYVDSPGCWIIIVSSTGETSWFDVL